MDEFLRLLLPRLITEAPFEIHPFQGKHDLLRKLPDRLRAYARWLPSNYRVLVVIDRDGDDCIALKQQLDRIGTDAGLTLRSQASAGQFSVVNRLAIEEL